MPETSPASPCVTVSIVSHRQWALARPLVEQLGRICRGTVARIVLTLNLPEDVDIDPDVGIPVDIVRNASAKGFGANHNAAFARCITPWFLVLNPDIRLDTGNDVPGALVAAARTDAGLLAPRIREPGRVAPEPYRELLSPRELVRRRLPGYQPPASPAWVAGMFMLVRRDAFAEVHGFDERFFMYCEDFDLCARLQLAGWALQVEPGQSVLHEAQRASHASLRPLAWHVASLLRLWSTPAYWRFTAAARQR